MALKWADFLGSEDPSILWNSLSVADRGSLYIECILSLFWVYRISGLWISNPESSPFDDALFAEFWIIVIVALLFDLLTGVFEKSNVDWRIWAVGLLFGKALLGSDVDYWPWLFYFISLTLAFPLPGCCEDLCTNYGGALVKSRCS